MTASLDLDLGYYMVGLMTRPQDWIARRVETLDFVGEGQTRRQISFDVDMDFARNRWPGDPERDSVPIPLTQLSKTPLALLDMRDSSGICLPILGTEQNGRAAWSALVAHATLVLQTGDDVARLPHGLVDNLHEVALRPRPEAESATAKLRQNSDPAIRELLADLAFAKQLVDLGSNFVLVTLVSPGPMQRTVLKFSYSYQPSIDPRWSMQKLAIARGEFVLPIPNLGEAASYHVQLVPPPGLEVESCRLDVVRPFESTTNVREGSHTGGQGHVHEANCPTGTTGDAKFVLRAPVRGALSAFSTAALIATGLLALAVVNPDRLQSLSGNADAAAFALLVPSLVATYLALPGEPSLTSRIMGTARGLLLLSALGLFALAVGVIGGMSRCDLHVLSQVALTVSTVSTVGLVGATALAWVRRTGR